jgi:oligoendopeptidase F
LVSLRKTGIGSGFDLFYSGDEKSGGLLQREQIDAKYTWDLTHIYATEALWEQDFTWVDSNYNRIKEFEGKLGDSADTLFAMFKLDQEITVKLEHLYLYSMLAKDQDMRQPRYQGLDNRIKSLYTNYATAASYITPELIALDKNTIRWFITTHSELKHYGHFFEELWRTKEHTLPKEQEELLASSSKISDLPYDAFSIFTNADLKFPECEDESGQKVQMTHGRYQSALYSPDRSYRERAYKAYYAPYKDYANTLSTLFNGGLNSKIFYSGARKYASALESSLDKNNVPISVYENLISSVSDNLAPMHRWTDLKRKVLGLEGIHPYDVYVGLFDKNEERKYTYEEGIAIVKAALSPLGEDYGKMLDKAFDNRWVDVYETPGKRSGAYSSGTTYGMHPYVLLNWSSLLNDVFTLAHEMGHNMHSFLTGKHQPFVYADYSIFLAEVASTFNESLLLEYLLGNAGTKEEKISLMERYLNNVSATFYRQTMFAEFELLTYRKVEKGEALTPDDLREMYSAVYKKYMGPALVLDKEEEYTWARVPHFYYNFYVYQYATGFAASEALAQQVLSDGAPAIERYFSFLKAGKSDYPINILKQAGVDMATSEPIIRTAKKMNAILDALESLIEK